MELPFIISNLFIVHSLLFQTLDRMHYLFWYPRMRYPLWYLRIHYPVWYLWMHYPSWYLRMCYPFDIVGIPLLLYQRFLWCIVLLLYSGISKVLVCIVILLSLNLYDAISFSSTLWTFEELQFFFLWTLIPSIVGRSHLGYALFPFATTLQCLLFSWLLQTDNPRIKRFFGMFDFHTIPT